MNKIVSSIYSMIKSYFSLMEIENYFLYVR